jgi:hypothetical protein
VYRLITNGFFNRIQHAATRFTNRAAQWLIRRAPIRIAGLGIKEMAVDEYIDPDLAAGGD